MSGPEAVRVGDRFDGPPGGCFPPPAGRLACVVRVREANHGEVRAVRITAPPRRIPVGQAAAVWTLVFLIGLTGGELLRQQTLDAPALAATSGPTEPTTATPARAPAAVAPSATSTTTSPPPTTTTIECDLSSCRGHRGNEESRSEDGESGRAHGKGGKGRGHGKGAEPGAG
jgi:hypothetical protein